MQSTLRLVGSRPTRLRFVRRLARFVRARLREVRSAADSAPDLENRRWFRYRGPL